MTARADAERRPVSAAAYVPPPPPDGLAAAGAALWIEVTAGVECESHELRILHEAARTLDLLESLQAEIEARGVVVDSPQGLKAAPAVVEIRQQRIVFARLVAAVGIPAAEGEAPARKPRGAYRARTVG